jgi:hypothetical protein
MSPEAEQKFDWFEALGALLSPALEAWCVWVSATVIHIVWRWFPPFGSKLPSVAELFALLVLLRLSGVAHGSATDDPSIWKSAVMNTLLPLLYLAAVALFRWCTS